ncbi:SDR family NAD(P)-dependent oxidoreductase [Citreimonas salinaria]|uniref:NAD(P)-dependent dehydrogenase, short-chain alcohol dehydrogenase family n=1 Tax=Citreimonas salinaria TaxID=321339 RepID=A0A1H3F8N4_9RHOB|nr:SDR family NAD(P)-dependent oxidoreductase [Citreimonas salinaria]SDX87383.1 NAD(P)-dependent dehydrogenase, short-chain alcohol dehydrogenase family [Citreimonas salinaria]
MESALIIGDSGGIGGALGRELRGRGTAVTGLSRSEHALDVTDEASVEAALGALDGPFDLIFVATGALEIGGAEPEKALRDLTPTALMNQVALNALGPALVLKHAQRLLPRRERAVFAALSARVGSIGDNRLGGWYSYRAAKAALNQLMHGAAIELARSHRHLCVACLHPGTVQTAFTEKYLDRHPSVPADEAAKRLANVLENLTPEHTGGFYDYAMREIPW